MCPLTFETVSAPLFLRHFKIDRSTNLLHLVIECDIVTYHKYQCLYQHVLHDNVPEGSQDQGRIRNVHKMDNACEVSHALDSQYLCTTLDHNSVLSLSLAHWHVSNKQSMQHTLIYPWKIPLKE